MTPVDGGTRVDVVADHVPAGIGADDHAAGLRWSVVNLTTHVEKMALPAALAKLPVSPGHRVVGATVVSPESDAGSQAPDTPASLRGSGRVVGGCQVENGDDYGVEGSPVAVD